MTYRDLCELLSVWLYQFRGRLLTPEAIWNISPSGELWPVHELRVIATFERQYLFNRLVAVGA